MQRDYRKLIYTDRTARNASNSTSMTTWHFKLCSALTALDMAALSDAMKVVHPAGATRLPCVA